MARYGYMATIGADTSGLATALTDLERHARSIQGELRSINFDVNNDGGAVALQQQYTVLQQAIENTRNKLVQLRAAEEAVNRAAANGTISEQQQRSFQRELASTENRLRRYENELERTQVQLNGTEHETEQLEHATNSAGRAAVGFGDLLKANIAGDLIADGLRQATDAIVGFAKQGIELASNLTEVQNVVDTTFGDGAQEIYDFSKTAAESFGLSSLSAQQYAGTIGAMIESAGIANDQAKEMSISIAGLAGDMASFYNLDTDTAFEKLRSGISGETEPLKQLGINLSVANLEAYAMSQGIETAWKSMSQAEQTTLRYNYLMQATANAQGDFAKTSDSFANQQRILQLNLQNVSAELGQALLPSLGEMLQKVNDVLSNGAETSQVINEVVNVLTTLGNIVAKTTEFLYDNRKALGYVAGGLAAITAALKIQSIIQAAVTGYTALAASLGTTTIAQTALNVAMDANPIGVVIASVTALIAIYDLLTTSFKELQGKAAESMQEYENANQRLEETTSKLEENQTALKDLQKQWDKGFHTQALADQLNSLQENTAELEAQLKIQQEKAFLLQKEAELDAVNLLNSEKNTDSLASATQMLQDYQDGLVYIADLEKQRDADLAAAKAARSAGREDEAKELEESARAWEDEIAIAADGNAQLKESLVFTAAALGEQREKISGVTEEGKVAATAIDSFTEEVATLAAAWNTVPGSVTTEYKVDFVENVIGNINNVAQNMLAKGKSMQEQAAELQKEQYEKNLDDELTALEHNLKTKKISESEYYSQMQGVLNKNRNENNEKWWAAQDKITQYYEQSAEKQNKAAKDAAEKAKKEQEDTAKKTFEALQKQYDRGQIDRDAFNKQYDELVKKWGGNYKDLVSDTNEKVADINAKAIDEANKEELEAWKKGAKETADVLTDAYDKLADQKEDAKQELLDIDLADTVTNDKGKDVTVLNDLSAEKRQMLEYQKSIEELKKTGISDSLLSEIGSMDYQSGDRQNYINSLLSLKPDNLDKYYSDWESIQSTAEQVSQSMIKDDLDALNQKTADAVNGILGSMPAAAYSEGQKTAQSYLQGIVDSMTGVNSSADISGILGKTTATTSASQQKTVPISTPIIFNIDGKAAIKTTLEEVLKSNKLTGGNNLNL